MSVRPLDRRPAGRPVRHNLHASRPAVGRGDRPRLRALAQALRAPAQAAELVSEQEYRALFAREQGTPRKAARLRRPTRGLWPARRRLSTGVAAVAAILFTGLGGAAAACPGPLPQSLQHLAHQVVGAPSPDAVEKPPRQPVPPHDAATPTPSRPPLPAGPSDGNPPGPTSRNAPSSRSAEPRQLVESTPAAAPTPTAEPGPAAEPIPAGLESVLDPAPVAPDEPATSGPEGSDDEWDTDAGSG